MGDFIDNKIILRSVYGKVGQKYTIQPCKDKYGNYPDCVKYVDSKGDMILTDKEKNDGKIYIPEDKAITFESGKTFDLLNPNEAAQWEAIKNCPLIAKAIDQKDKNGNYILGSKGPHYSAAELYIEKPGYETSVRVSRKQKVHDAESYIFGDTEGAEGRLKHARLLGKHLRNAPDSDVLDFLLDRASKNPDEIIKLYTGDDLPLRILFMEAKDKNVIYSKNKVYIYGDGIALGQTIDSVIAWMRDPRNVKMLELIKRDTYSDELEVTNPNAKKALENKK